MFKIDSDKTIRCTRGDCGNFKIRKKIAENILEPFYAGDVIKFTVKNNFGDSEVLLRKEIEVAEDTNIVTFSLNKEDTTIGDLIASPVRYQYDIAINDDKTVLGYDDESGPKYFILYPEGSNDV